MAGRFYWFRILSGARAVQINIYNHTVQLNCQNINVSKTIKDSAQRATRSICLEVTKNRDGTYEIVFNGTLVQRSVPERWLDNELCAKRGFCLDELDKIRQQLEEYGRAIYEIQ